jgi:hypothetical protein
VLGVTDVYQVIMNLDIEVMLSAKWQTVRTVLTDMLRQWGCQVRILPDVHSGIYLYYVNRHATTLIILINYIHHT